MSPYLRSNNVDHAISPAGIHSGNSLHTSAIEGATVDIFDRSQAPVYEPLVFAKVLDIAEEYGYTHDVTPREFLRTLAILETAKHVRRVRRVEPRVGGGPSLHLEPTEAGRSDIKASRELLRKVLARGI